MAKSTVLEGLAGYADNINKSKQEFVKKALTMVVFLVGSGV